MLLETCFLMKKILTFTKIFCVYHRFWYIIKISSFVKTLKTPNFSMYFSDFFQKSRYFLFFFFLRKMPYSRFLKDYSIFCQPCFNTLVCIKKNNHSVVYQDNCYFLMKVWLDLKQHNIQKKGT